MFLHCKSLEVPWKQCKPVLILAINFWKQKSWYVKLFKLCSWLFRLRHENLIPINLETFLEWKFNQQEVTIESLKNKPRKQKTTACSFFLQNTCFLSFDLELQIPDLRSHFDELSSLIFRQTHCLSSDSSALPLIHFDLFGTNRLGLSVGNCCTTSCLSWMRHSCVGICHYPDLWC